MLILGLCGGTDLVHEDAFDLEPTASHDAAAVLVEDGEVVAAIEQERLDRIKHSNKLPIEAAAACLAARGAALSDVDAVAYATSRPTMELRLRRYALRLGIGRPGEARPRDPAAFLCDAFRRSLGADVPPEKIHFVRHHVAHAVSAFACSGFDRSLIVTLDGVGEGESGRVAVGEGARVETLQIYPESVSLGHFYQRVIHHLGYRLFDEHKVMGLAPHGDPSRFRAELARFYELLPEGRWTTDLASLPRLFDVLEPRRRGAPFEQSHQDLAAALQEALENIVFHALRHLRQATGETHLCLAGGVAHNCTLNGKIAASGLFQGVFVQPAAHDAGNALGAALALAYEHVDRSGAPASAALSVAGEAQPARSLPRRRGALSHVFWGTDVAAVDPRAVLERWRDFVAFERFPDIEERTAARLAAGSAVGWVQGRSEFGPRALGHRSILADPRPAENRITLNSMVKKREGYRPFAPSVPEEDAADWFDLTGLSGSPFMTFVVPVLPHRRALLGAVTHVDGSARVHTVSRSVDPRFWALLRAFERLTGCPVLLDTSFNNHAEPIVDSVEDAVVTFLTTDLPCLVVGDCMVEKRRAPLSAHRALVPRLPRWAKLEKVRRTSARGPVIEHAIVSNADRHARKAVSAGMFEVLLSAGDASPGDLSLGELLDARGIAEPARVEALLAEAVELWSSRMIVLAPRAEGR
jgi:carbamoyltransferase